MALSSRYKYFSFWGNYISLYKLNWHLVPRFCLTLVCHWEINPLTLQNQVLEYVRLLIRPSHQTLLPWGLSIDSHVVFLHKKTSWLIHLNQSFPSQFPLLLLHIETIFPLETCKILNFIASIIWYFKHLPI